VRRLDAGERGRLAGYLAKYTTKSTDTVGGVVRRVAEHEVDVLPVREHVRAYLRTAFDLAANPGLGERRFGRCAHALGYRGHCLTKSRRYSTTFKALRQAREDHVRQRLIARSRDSIAQALAGAEERIVRLVCVGAGHLTAADAFLAASAAARARERRAAAHDAAACEGDRGQGT
jgi:replication initiator protein RepSA